jgi:hypothetical protein
VEDLTDEEAHELRIVENACRLLRARSKRYPASASVPRYVWVRASRERGIIRDPPGTSGARRRGGTVGREQAVRASACSLLALDRGGLRRLSWSQRREGRVSA